MLNQLSLGPTLRRIVVALAYASLLATFQKGTAAEPAALRALRVLSYNIHHGEGVDGKLDLARIAAVIKSTKPDIVALQEVDQKTTRTGNVDQVAELARLTDMEHVFGGNIRLQGGEYGNAVLSKHRIKRHQNHALPCLDNSEQRGVLEVEIAVPGAAQPLVLLATHLDYRPNDQERIASAKQINELAAKFGARPMLLAGDLNDDLESKTLEEFQTRWASANTKTQPTVPVDKPTRQIDFILLHPAERWKVRDLRVLDEPLASDHRPVLAILELPAGADESDDKGEQ